ncbi:hypothetical protein O3M35_002196 [Rhynocoris fuscipes]|uniref:Uncharacterized protein n=1 Tax=Rhynocoris fuscipes TaxID=488301 RepID=A0AAW1CS02_9HEMI
MQQLWETLLQEVEADSQAHGEIASVLGRQVSRDTLEKTFYRKLEARKLLQHRDYLDAVLNKSQHNLSKLRQDYKAAYTTHCQSPNSQATLATYLDAHNTYVSQLHATNAMVDIYSKETLPELLQVSIKTLFSIYISLQFVEERYTFILEPLITPPFFIISFFSSAHNRAVTRQGQ